jgi:hypothetical protein
MQRRVVAAVSQVGAYGLAVVAVIFDEGDTMRFFTSELVAGLGTRLELGRADTLSFVGVVIALYLVRKRSELFCLNVWVKLDIQGALPVSIAPPFTGGPVLLAGWRAEHGTQFRLALADK